MFEITYTCVSALLQGKPFLNFFRTLGLAGDHLCVKVNDFGVEC